MKNLFFALTLFLLASCTSGIPLSNDEALSIIKEKYEGKGCYQYIEVIMNRDRNNKYATQIIENYLELEKQNLLDVRKGPIPGWGGNGLR